jgi:hypothetical protein
MAMSGPRKTLTGRASAAIACGLVLAALALPAAARADIIVRLEITADKAAVHLEPDSRSPVLETLSRGAVVKLSSATKFRTSWFYVQFLSSRSGRTLAGYIREEGVRKLNSTIKIVDLTPAGAQASAPKDLDLTVEPGSMIAWGMSREGVIQVEGRPFSREESDGLEYLSYRREVFGKRCLIVFVLASRRLVSVRVNLLENYADKDLYIAEYNKIREYLNHKLGEPRYNNVVWKDRAYAKRGEPLGVAVTSGSLSLSSEWVTGDTGLRLSLTGEPNGVLFAAEINDIKAKNPASF